MRATAGSKLGKRSGGEPGVNQFAGAEKAVTMNEDPSGIT